MITSLTTIAALTDTKGINLEEPDKDVLISLLRARLQAANTEVRSVLKTLKRATEVSPDDVRDLVNTLETTLLALPVNEAKAYIVTSFRPETLAEISAVSAASGRAIRQVLRTYCTSNNIPLLYAAWGQD